MPTVRLCVGVASRGRARSGPSTFGDRRNRVTVAARSDRERGPSTANSVGRALTTVNSFGFSGETFAAFRVAACDVFPDQQLDERVTPSLAEIAHHIWIDARDPCYEIFRELRRIMPQPGRVRSPHISGNAATTTAGGDTVAPDATDTEEAATGSTLSPPPTHRSGPVTRRRRGGGCRQRGR